MKILISLSNPKLVQFDFTGSNGCFSAVTPDSDGVAYIKAVAKAMGYPDIDPDSLHCTVMYSKQAPAADTTCDAAKVYKAKVVKIQHWDGHDKKGYLTLGLDSQDLQREHARLQSAGCVPTFEPYSPHVTLYAGVPMTPKLQSLMDRVTTSLEPLQTITFSSQSLGDLKDD